MYINVIPLREAMQQQVITINVYLPKVDFTNRKPLFRLLCKVDKKLNHQWLNIHYTQVSSLGGVMKQKLEHWVSRGQAVVSMCTHSFSSGTMFTSRMNIICMHSLFMHSLCVCMHICMCVCAPGIVCLFETCLHLSED